MPIVAKQRVHFGPFELDARAGELYKHGLKLKLQGHPIQILVMLLERPGELITREEIQQKLWPSESETFVDFEHGLNTAVRKLRQALGDEAETPQYIETLPRRGYRFVGEILAKGLAQSVSAGPSVAAADVTDTATAPLAGESVPITHAESAGATSAVELDVRATRRRLPFRPLLVLVLLPVALVIGVYVLRYMRGESGTLVVTGTRQLTQNGKLGLVTGTSARFGAIQTDGRRVYFTVIGENPLRFVSVNGVEETVLPSPVPNPRILHISPDGSTLIVRDIVGNEGKELAPVWLVQANGGSARKLGDVEVQDAAFAPDGKTIILAIENTLYLTDLSGTSPVKIVDTVGRPFWLRWSPDGERLRFSVLETKPPGSSIWELDRQGNVGQVLADWKGPGKTRPRICCGVWSKDGKYFLFWSNWQYWAMTEGARFAHVEPTLLTTGGQRVVEAAASPLSHTLFVNENLETYHSLKLDLNTQQMTPVYPELKPSFIEYSADGQWIAYRATSEEGRQLWRARKDGSDRRQLTTAPMWVYMFRFSPDGRKIAVMANTPAGQWKIYWVSVDGGDLHGIPSPPVSHCDPNWSPDGESILFGQTPKTWAEPGAPRHIYVYDLRTGKTVEIEGSTGLFSPRWSPDGRYVVAMRIDFQGMSLLDRTTGKWRVLTQQSTDEPFWSPDSAWIYFNDFDDTTVWRVSARTAKLERVMTTPRPPNYSQCNARSFAPDGNMMLNCRHTQGDVFALDYR